MHIARHHTLPKIGLPLIMCPDICSFQCTCTRPPKLEVAKGPRCGINVHFPTGRIVTTPRDGGHSLPTRPCRPDFHIFHFFRVFCVLPRFFTLFSVPSLFPSVLCRGAFLATHFFPPCSEWPPTHSPTSHRKFEAKLQGFVQMQRYESAKIVRSLGQSFGRVCQDEFVRRA